MHKYIIYTDGAYSQAREQGGVGFLIIENDKEIKSYSKKFLKSTNQRMEMLACAIALEALNEPSEVLIVSDSQYLIKTYTDNWKRKANTDLWERLDIQMKKHTVTFKWVKGHKDDEFNKKVDRLAYNASQEL